MYITYHTYLLKKGKKSFFLLDLKIFATHFFFLNTPHDIPQKCSHHIGISTQKNWLFCIKSIECIIQNI